MNTLDIIIGIILILFALAGYRKGLIIEAFYLASLIIGIYGAMYFSDFMAGALANIINVKAEYMALIAFIITFILFVIVIRNIGRLIKNIIDAIYLGFIDKIGGFVFGTLKGALIISIVIMLLNNMNLSDSINKDTRDKSFLYSKVENVANTLYKNHDLIEESINNSFNKGVEAIEEILDN